MLISYKGHLFISLIKAEIMYPAWNKNDVLHFLCSVSKECYFSVCVEEKNSQM